MPDTDQRTDAEEFAAEQEARERAGKPVLPPETESEDLTSASTRSHTAASTFDPDQEPSDRRAEDRAYDVPDGDAEAVEQVPLRGNDRFDLIVVAHTRSVSALDLVDGVRAEHGALAEGEDADKAVKALRRDILALGLEDPEAAPAGSVFSVLRVDSEASAETGLGVFTVEAGLVDWPGDLEPATAA